jgi:succinylglutamate desuccinylase
VKGISEKLATELKRNVVVVAGIHWDDLTAQEIEIIEDLTQKMSDQILKKLRKKS